jgi:LEA14-like dessication related protein
MSFAFLGLIVSCKTVKPAEVPEEIILESLLTFENIEAETPETLFFNCRLDLNNTRFQDAKILFQNSEFSVNGMRADAAFFSIEFPPNIQLLKREQKSVPLRLVFHAAEYERSVQFDFDEYDVILNIPVQYMFDDTVVDTFAQAKMIFPRVRKPDFNITQIKVVQAELINTRLRVSIRIDNPNHFPVELSSFNYELYGDGRFWAKDTEQDILVIPEKESSEIDLFLTMNFTNMRRNVLDQVIKMTEVRYRFKGNANVETGVPHLPRFITDFEHAGHSGVVR